ncbi:UNVERIFIED_CONTAM: hypothetical protein Sradi_0846800 [Sesamum radiatum]|uniref:Uncharacterized protein n=1 Tax=Sesamum radiatum TaxID=300843 RepID=A0AAW2V3D6_SESRA
MVQILTMAPPQNVVVALCTEGDAEVALQKWGDLASPPFRHPFWKGWGQIQGAWPWIWATAVA